MYPETLQVEPDQQQVVFQELIDQLDHLGLKINLGLDDLDLDRTRVCQRLDIIQAIWDKITHEVVPEDDSSDSTQWNKTWCCTKPELMTRWNDSGPLGGGVYQSMLNFMQVHTYSRMTRSDMERQCHGLHHLMTFDPSGLRLPHES